MKVVPNEIDVYTEIRGNICEKCESFICSGEIAYENLTYNTQQAMLYNWDYTYYHKWENERLFYNNPSAIALFLLFAEETKTYREIIICSRKSTITQGTVEFHYKHEIAKALLTMVIQEDEKATITLHHQKYRLVKVKYAKDNESPPVLHEIRLRKYGGLYSAAYREQDEIVDAMLYSPYTKKYEFAYASYDKEEEDYCMDTSVFRNFIKRYGNPKIYVYPTTAQKRGYIGGDALHNLNTESLLHIYGYNVSQNSRLTKRERQDILSELVDLEIMDVRRICLFLEQLIRMHTSEKYALARSKWEEDYAFIQSYKLNPERFIILR